ncbi:MAG: prepilin-type N-terminal cleavage/methylation domain-containing protein [Gemmatimonadales bacterium]
MQPPRGFTLFEVTITLCILGILSAIAMPSARALIDRIHVHGAVMEIESLFSSARHIAIARSTQATVEIDPLARAIYVMVGADTVRKGEVGANHDVLLSASRVRMSYAATGMGYGAANLSVFVQRSSSADTVFVSRLGRLRH